MSTLFSHFFTKINQISPLKSDFTEVLASIALVPKILYFYGKMPENVVKNGGCGGSGVGKRPPVVAIVGSRHNTRYGEEVAYKLAYELGEARRSGGEWAGVWDRFDCASGVPRRRWRDGGGARDTD